jgi:hypothetical protein
MAMDDGEIRALRVRPIDLHQPVEPPHEFLYDEVTLSGEQTSRDELVASPHRRVEAGADSGRSLRAWASRAIRWRPS